MATPEAAALTTYNALNEYRWQPKMPGFMFPGLSGQQGQALGALIQPFIGQMAGSLGLAGLQFGSTQSLYDTFQAQQFMADRARAMTIAGQADQARMIEIMRGISGAAGAPWDATTAGRGREESGRRLADTISPMMPFFTMMMPDVADRMYGRVGSAQVMAMRVMDAARFGVDPVTGYYGMSGESAGQLSRGLYQNLYGNEDAIFRMRGITAGQAGGMYSEMQRRGLMGGMDPSTRIGAAVMGLGGGLAGPGAGVMGGMSETSLREAEVQRVSRNIKGMAGTVAAMKDIFGDAGDPEAPMPKLMKALDMLTQGGAFRMSGPELTSKVRQMQQIMRYSGHTVESMTQLIGYTAGITDQLGLDRSYAADIAVQSAAARQSFVTSRFAGERYFGRLDPDMVERMSAQFTAQAAASPRARQINALFALRDQYRNTAGFDVSGLKAVTDALEAGGTRFKFGGRDMDLADMNQKEVEGVIGGLVAPGEMQVMMTRGRALQGYGDRYGTAGLVRSMQGRELANNAILSGLLGTGVLDTDRARQISTRLFQTSFRDKIKGPVTHASIADALLSDLNIDAATAQRIRIPLISGLMEAEENIGRVQGLEGVGSIMNLAPMFGEEALANQRRLAETMRRRGALQTAMKGLSADSILGRLVEYITEAGPNATLQGMLATGLAGGVSKDALTKALQTADDTKLISLTRNVIESRSPAELELNQKAFEDYIGQVAGQFKGLQIATPAEQAAGVAASVAERARVSVLNTFRAFTGGIPEDMPSDALSPNAPAAAVPGAGGTTTTAPGTVKLDPATVVQIIGSLNVLGMTMGLSGRATVPTPGP